MQALAATPVFDSPCECQQFDDCEECRAHAHLLAKERADREASEEYDFWFVVDGLG